MDVRIGLDRPSMRTNALIYARADVGRARETLIYAPARIQASDVVFGRPGVAADARDTARDALRWCERAPETSTDAGTGAMDLVAMNKAATSAKCATSAEVRKFRRDAEDPVRLRARRRRRRPETPPRDLDATHGRPSHLRDADELRHACGTTPSTTVRSLIEGAYARDWIDARRVGGDVNRRSQDDGDSPPTTRRVVDARRDVERARERARERDALARAAREKVPFKMKKFTRATPRVFSH